MVSPPRAGSPEKRCAPGISRDPHFWYAVQWFCTGFAVAGIVVFIRATCVLGARLP